MFARSQERLEAASPVSAARPRSREVEGRTAAAVDLGLVLIAFVIAFGLRQHLGAFEPLRWRPENKLLMLCVVTGSWGFYGFVLRLYDSSKRRLSQELILLSGVAFLTGLTTGSLAFLLHLSFLSRPLVVLYLGTAFVETAGFRVLARSGAQSLSAERKVIVVGSGAVAERICAQVSTSGAELLGVIPEEGSSAAVSGVRVLGPIEQAEAIFRSRVVDEVIFAVPRTKLDEVEQAFSAAEDLGLETKLLLNFLPNRFARIEYAELEGTPLLSFRSAPAHPVQLGLKRLFDLAVSAIALVARVPVFLVIAAAIKLTSKGPVFFGQKRSGLNGREFIAWKFRSMVMDAEEKLAELRAHNEVTGPVFKMKEDPRVTTVGRFLRKTSLDEIPQFWNVFVGEMSIVGPRPPIPAEVALYTRQQRRRLSVKPGITCIWQVKGRSSVDFDTWMEMDLEYIDRWSLALDVKLFLQTIPAVILGRGAH